MAPKEKDDNKPNEKEPIHFVKPHYQSRVDVILAVIDRGLDE